MSLEKLVQHIERDAEQEASRIIAEAKQQADDIIRKAKEQAKKDAQEIASQGEKNARRTREKRLAAARRAAREQHMRVKEEVMQECLQRAREMLSAVKGKEYEKAVRAAIEEGQKVFSDCVVRVSREADRKIADRLGVEVAGTVDGLGGVIVQSADGSRQIDRTFDALMERKMGDLRIMMAEQLFPEEV
ncbi:MAG TPA: hypothetical protein ENN54_01395 [Thermoplasmatales archaeon]|nr:hypothetical protein [Thermoplasmatales archaeon]